MISHGKAVVVCLLIASFIVISVNMANSTRAGVEPRSNRSFEGPKKIKGSASKTKTAVMNNPCEFFILVERNIASTPNSIRTNGR